MRSITKNNRRSTRDADLDFIHYSLEDESIKAFVQKMNCIEGLRIEMSGEIKELRHKDYHGKSIDKNVHQFCENLLNYVEGKPLQHVVDKAIGY